MSASAPQAPVVSFEAARRVVEEHAQHLRPQGRELLELIDSVGFVLAETIAADRQLPPFPRSARDGYAVRSDDVKNLPARLQVTGEIKAGIAPDSMPTIAAGQAALIMTGAPVPQGADAVIMVEYTSRDGDTVELQRTIESGANIVPAGSEAKRGEKLLSPDMRIDHSVIAVAASVGRSRVVVYGKPTVAVLATGDEIVDIDVPPGPYQIRNSNSYSLAAQIVSAGAEPLLLPIAPDEPTRLRELISDGFEADLLLITGGVSMGKYDLVEQVLREFNAEFFFTGAEIQPGRPIVFGRVPADFKTSAAGAATPHHRYFFGLPGNPISTMVTFELFVKPVLRALTGQPVESLRFLHARLKSEINTKTGLKRFLPATLSGQFEGSEVELLRWQGSGDIAANARANCYIVIPPDRERIPAGEWIPVLLR